MGTLTKHDVSMKCVGEFIYLKSPSGGRSTIPPSITGEEEPSMGTGRETPAMFVVQSTSLTLILLSLIPCWHAEAFEDGTLKLNLRRSAFAWHRSQPGTLDPASCMY